MNGLCRNKDNVKGFYLPLFANRYSVNYADKLQDSLNGFQTIANIFNNKSGRQATFRKTGVIVQSMQKKDETLVTRLQKGERKAMEELYDTYSPVLLGVAMRYSNRREDAEDLVHEALLRILKGVRDFRETFTGSFEVWMRRITVNQCLSALRKKNDFQHLVSTEKMEARLSDEDEETSELPDISPEQLLTMMQSLPDGYRTVLNLYVFEKLSHKEIAKELNISENTSKSQLAKARMSMKRKLSQLQNKEEFA